jgi:hypothetical protein
MKTQAERAAYRRRFAAIDFRANPEKYRVGRGEEGVLSIEPYKSEILPHWKFKTPEQAEKSAAKIYEMFLNYLTENDFVGADMARKFLQMGYTRSRRYANHRSGKKYKGKVPENLRGISGAHGRAELPREVDEEKAESARRFYAYYQRAKQNEQYQTLLKKHKEKFESGLSEKASRAK